MEMIFFEKKEMQTILFYIMAIAAGITNAFGCFLNAYLYGVALPTQICVIGEIIILLITTIGLFLKDKKWATIGILVTVIWIEFPMLYLVYNNVILAYFILGILGIIVFFPRRFHVIFSLATIIWDALWIIYTYLCPKDFGELDKRDMFVFSACTYLIVAFTLFGIMNAVIMVYERQRTELEEANKKLFFMATHDSLTKLYNREYLMREMENRIQEGVFSVAILDIDNFKSINDTYGHAFGDYVLVSFAKILEKEILGKGFAARYGGEEFMLVFENDNREDALQILQGIREQLSSFFKKEKNILVTFSGGLEIYSEGMALDELIKNADAKLYEAKRNGKNRVI